MSLNETRLAALTPNTKYLLPVTERSFLPHLAGLQLNRNTPADFPPRFKLEKALPGFNRAYTMADDEMIPEELLEGVDLTDPKNISNIAKEAALGRTQILFYDGRTQQIQATATRAHTRIYPALEAAKLYLQRKPPLLEIRRRDHDAPIDPADYYGMFSGFGDSTYSIRFIRGLLVVGPNIQTLALVTSGTLLASPDIDKGEGIDEVYEYLREYVRGFASQHGRHEIPEDFNLKGKSIEDLEKQLERLKFHPYNNFCLEFARYAKVKLYSSTNLQDFTEVSA